MTIIQKIKQKEKLMNRRNFLKFNALTLASMGVAYANPMHDMHSMHKNHSINHDLDTSFINFAPKNLKLLDPKQFPQGEILKALPLLKNESKEKNIFRATLEIKENHIELIKGKKTLFYTYNGLVPAPKIEVFEGDKLEILVKNKLKEATTIHWHGVPVPPDQDGSPHDPILAGEERIYRFEIPQDSAGTYWYHPHPHYTASKQVFMGLAGAFVIKAKKDALSHLKEKDLMISDLRLDENAQIPNNNLNDWLNGREGEFVLINGQFKPKIKLATNERIRIYNATAARYLNLRIQGAKFILVGTDGGLIEKAIYKEDLFNSKIYVACDKQKIIGFIAVKLNILDYIYVDPAYQGQGVGKNLISYVLRMMKRPITLEVFQENKVAKKLYSHFGFKTKKIIYQQWDGNDPQKYSDETMVLEK